MKQLEKSYKKNGAYHTQIYRVGNVAIYEMTSPESGRILAYEVFEVKQNPDRVLAGVNIPASESTPGNEEWGSKGFTVWTKSAAFLKAEMIQKNINRRNEMRMAG